MTSFHIDVYAYTANTFLIKPKRAKAACLASRDELSWGMQEILSRDRGIKVVGSKFETIKWCSIFYPFERTRSLPAPATNTNAEGSSFKFK